MNRPASPRRYGLALSAAGVAMLLLAALLLAGSARSAGGPPGGLANIPAGPSAHPHPEYAGQQIIGAIASLYVDDSLVGYGERLGLIVLGFGEDVRCPEASAEASAEAFIEGMEVLNSPGFVPKSF